jgi:hypothetical protein
MSNPGDSASNTGAGEDAPVTRICLHCRHPQPIEKFKVGSKTRVCIKHAREMRLRYSLGTLEKRAFNSLRLRARHDRFAFRHGAIQLSSSEALAHLTPEQLCDYPRWSLVPRCPERVLDARNAVLVTNYQRRYLMCQWRTDRCPVTYKNHLAFLLAKAAHGPPTLTRPSRPSRPSRR